MSRFAYVKYDETAQRDQAEAKADCVRLESTINMIMPEGQSETSRARENALKSLEECYMWIGKGIRDQQVAARKDATPQEERTNS